MAYSPEDRTRIVSEICALISNGLSLRKALKAQKDSINKESFYSWLDEDKEKVAQYARACDERVEFMADEIIEISDFAANDTISTEKGDIPDNEWINRSKLRVDTRKWLMSKMRPSKYGDKVGHSIFSLGLLGFTISPSPGIGFGCDWSGSIQAHCGQPLGNFVFTSAPIESLISSKVV